MVQIEKLVCFLFTLLVIYMINQQCKYEGLSNLDSFDNCIDDPNWFVVNKEGKRLRCADIGEGASCYDRDDTQREGWERCLKTCGNCSKTEVTQSSQKNLAMFSGDPVEDFGVVMFVDDDRKFFGMGVGEEVVDEETGETELVGDVRSIFTEDESEDVVDLYDRVSVIEDLYDMLLGSVSSCLDCSQYDDDATLCNSQTGCEYAENACQTIEPDGDNFISCNGSELSCEYDPETLTEDDTSSDDVVYQYVKHQCDVYGNCNIMFPTYEMSCNEIPEPEPLTHQVTNVTYNPAPIDECINNSDILDISNTPTEPGNECFISPPSIEREITIEENKIVVNEDESWSNVTQVQISCDSEEPTDVTLEDYQEGDESFSITGEIYNSENMPVDGCIITATMPTEIVDNCYNFTPDQLSDSNMRELCSNLCKDNDPDNEYFVLDETKCYCLESMPETSYPVSGGNCVTDTLRIYDHGETVSVSNIVDSSNLSDDDTMRNMCKQYFLLDTALTGEDTERIDEDSMNRVDSMTDRISLYDICPRQCAALGCDND